jgi:BNR/Asp-box repeat
MKRTILVVVAALAVLAGGLAKADSIRKDPTWWDKYQFLLKNGSDPSPGGISSLAVGANVDISNECGPQSETFITINPSNPSNLAAGSNEIFRDPMRGYFSFDGGATWGGVDLPLPTPIGTNGTDFGSDPSLAFDTQGNVYYAYIVVFFGNGNGINGTAMAVAKSSDGGQTYPNVTYFSFQGGENHFNDKPIIAVDTNPDSPFRDNVYVAWDAALGGSMSGGLRFARSSNGGATFTVTRADDPHGQGRLIGADPFVGPNGEVYVAWNDYRGNTIGFNRSLDGGATWGTPSVVASKSIAFDIGIPAESFRGALVYPACDADRSSGPNRGRLSCSWMDLSDAGTTDILLAYSDDQGATWSSPAPVTDPLSIDADRFNHWLSVDPMTGGVNVSFYDTRNDTTGERFENDVYLASSLDGGVTWAPNVRVSTESSNEHDCDGTFPCQGINYGNQQGDYEGLVSYGGVSYPVWTDSRRQLDPATGCRRPYLMEEVFTAAVE